MSLITDDPNESPRDCSRSSRKHQHHHHHGSRSGNRRALIAASSTVASLLSLALILWLTLRPSNPRFSLLAATTTSMSTAADGSNNNDSAAVIVVDAAFAAHNPNAHASALYDQLRASASYAGVPLGAGAPLPPLEQLDGQGDVVLSAMLTSPPRTPQAVGARALLRVRVEGQLRWKVAAWVSGRHGLTVDCVTAVVLQPSPSPGAAGGGVVPVQQGPYPSQCATHVL